MNETKLQLHVTGSVRGAGAIQPGPWLEAIADRLGPGTLVAFTTPAGETAFATLTAAAEVVTGQILEPYLEVACETDADLAAPPPRIAGLDTLREELDRYGERLRAADERRPTRPAA